jgi:hypothetical protein
MASKVMHAPIRFYENDIILFYFYIYFIESLTIYEYTDKLFYIKLHEFVFE